MRNKGTNLQYHKRSMADHNDFGVRGEELAREYLQEKGYVILETNYRISNAEVDIVAKYNKLIVFVEVKTRRQSKYGNPEIAVNREKRGNMKRVARGYINIHRIKGEVRFDIISIILSMSGNAEVTHFEDAFFLR